MTERENSIRKHPGILNARILWTFASAYRVLGNPDYLQMALRARDQILGPFWDSDFGGTYWSLDSEGHPLDTKKQIYSIAFAIYGLSELYRASGDELALRKAVELFHIIEEHSLDPVCGGYFEAFRSRLVSNRGYAPERQGSE